MSCVTTESRTLNTGARMPVIGLGTWLSNKPDDIAISIPAALDAGYRHIDTAFLYKNEEDIGEALQKAFSQGKVKRDDVFITTKLPNYGHSREKVKEYLEKSLDSLQLDYVDMYLIHTPLSTKSIRVLPTEEEFKQDPKDTHYTDVWKGMEDVFEAGMAKAIGLSNFNSHQIQCIIDNSRVKPANLQVECHPYLPQNELFEFCKQRNIVFTAYAPFGSPGLKNFAPGLKPGTEDEIVPLFDPVLKPLCEKHNKTAAQIILRWLYQRGMVVIPKSSNPERIKQNAQIFDFKLSEEDIAVIKSMKKNRRYYNFVDMMPWINKHPHYPFNDPF